MVDAISTAVGGLLRAGDRFEASAKKIANVNLTLPSQQANNNPDTVVAPVNDSNDLESAIIEQKLAAYDYKANLKTIKVANELTQNLLDILS